MRVLISVVALAFFGMQSGPGEDSLRLVGSIALPGVEGRIDHLAFDAASQRLFVAALGNHTIEVLDVTAGNTVKSLPGLREPQGIVVVPDARLIAVADGEGDGLELLSADDYHRARLVHLGDDSDNVRYDGAAKRVFVGFGAGALAVIDPNDGKVLGESRLAGHPESFQLERSGRRIFVNVPTAGHIAVVDRSAMKVVATWPVVSAKSNFPMALDETGHRVFVGCRNPAKMLVYDTASGREVASVDIVGDTDDLFYDEARKRIYVTGGDGFVDIIRSQGDATFTREARVRTAAGARTSLFVADQNRLFIAVPRRGSQRAEIRIYNVR